MTTAESSGTGVPDRPTKLPKQFRISRGQRVVNRLMARLIRWGLVPHSFVMTVPGRKTGRPRMTPVTLVEHDDGKRWLVAPYGPVNWVHNVRAAGRVLVERRGFHQSFDVREVVGGEAAPVLQEYLRIAGAVRSYFYANRDSPVEVFVKEAHLHPVFELTAVQ
jgi:deazaflavin-dependent oxidoreductase (nitroreductase family)